MTAGYGGDYDNKLCCLSVGFHCGPPSGSSSATPRSARRLSTGIPTILARKTPSISMETPEGLKAKSEIPKTWPPYHIIQQTQVESTTLTVLRLLSHKQVAMTVIIIFRFLPLFYTPILERRKTCQVISHDRVPLGGPSPNTKTAMPDLKKKKKNKRKK